MNYARDQSRSAAASSELNAKAALDASIRSSRNDQRAWIGPFSTRSNFADSNGKNLYVLLPRLENLWVTAVFGTHGRRIENVGKPPCFNGFQVTLNMLKATFGIPAEPTWDSNVCAAPRSKGHFAVAVRCRPVSIRKPPGTGQRRVVLDFRPAGGRRSLLVLSS